MNMSTTLGPQLWPLEDDPTGEALVTQRAEDLQFYRRALNTLVEIGVNLAFTVQQLEIHRKADISLSGSNTPEPPAVFSLAFERISRGVRRTIHLAERIGQPPKPATDQTHRRQRRIRAVENTIVRAADNPANERLNAERLNAQRLNAGRLNAEVRERLDTEDFDDDDTRPIDDLIGEIRSDLGLPELPLEAKPRPLQDQPSTAAIARCLTPADVEASNPPHPHLPHPHLPHPNPPHPNPPNPTG
jgi:hypothetical protein